MRLIDIGVLAVVTSIVVFGCSKNRSFSNDDVTGEGGAAGAEPTPPEAGAGGVPGNAGTAGNTSSGASAVLGGAGGDSEPAGGGAGGQSAGGEGGAGPVANCDLSAPFGTPSLLFTANATERSGARFWPDELSVYFSTDGDLHRAERGSALVLFGAGAPLPNVNTLNLELSPVLTRDGRTLYFNNSGLGVLRMATRDSIDDDFGTPMNLGGLEAYPAAPYLAGDDDVLYYDAFDDSFSDRHIWRAEITSLGFSQSEPVVEETTGFAPSEPVVSRDELSLYLSATTPTGTDIYYAERASVSDPFPAPTRLDELSTDRADAPTWLSDDGCRIIIEADENPYIAAKPR
jgi:hypothetical protein